MLNVYVGLVSQHSLPLIAAACLICSLAAFLALSAFLYALEDQSHRPAFIALAAIISGLGAWATYFIAMLAYEPGASISYDAPRTLLSMLAAITISAIGWAVSGGQAPDRGVAWRSDHWLRCHGDKLRGHVGHPSRRRDYLEP